MVPGKKTSVLFEDRGKSLIDLQYIPQLDEIFKNIKDITAHQLMDIANEMFDESRLSVLTYHPN